MKRVSFETAQAIKDAGYPQGETDKCFDSKGVLHYTSSTDTWLPKDIYIDVPTYLEVWLWLWREKGYAIECAYKYRRFHNYKTSYSYADPEEAIIAAIEHWVNKQSDIINHGKNRRINNI